MDEASRAQTYCVLDLETRPDDGAVGCLGRGVAGGGAIRRVALHRIDAAAALLATRKDGTWSSFRLLSWDPLGSTEPAMLSAIGDLLGVLHDSGGALVTYNGTAHDLPVLRRRAAALWLFRHQGLRVWNDEPAGRHIDLMLDDTHDAARAPSLQDACAALLVPLNFAREGSAWTVPYPATRKAQIDVVATFVLLLHELALRSGHDHDVRNGLPALADFLRVDWGHAAHLAPFGKTAIVAAARAASRKQG